MEIRGLISDELYDTPFAVDEPIWLCGMQRFGLIRLQADHDFGLEGAQEEVGTRKIGVGGGDGDGVRPVAVVEQAAVVRVAFEDAQVGLSQLSA